MQASSKHIWSGQARMWVWSIIVGVVSQMWVWLVIVGMPRLHVEKVTQLIFINSIINTVDPRLSEQLRT